MTMIIQSVTQLKRGEVALKIEKSPVLNIHPFAKNKTKHPLSFPVYLGYNGGVCFQIAIILVLCFPKENGIIEYT